MKVHLLPTFNGMISGDLVLSLQELINTIKITADNNLIFNIINSILDFYKFKNHKIKKKMNQKFIQNEYIHF